MLGVYLHAAVDDPGLADDVFQETVIAAWRGLERYDRTRPFGAWLRGIAANQLKAAHRRGVQGILLVTTGDLSALEAHCHDLERVSGDCLEQRLELLHECMARLGEEDRTILNARYKEGLRGKSLAECIGASIEVTRKRVQRARARISTCVLGKLAIQEQGQ